MIEKRTVQNGTNVVNLMADTAKAYEMPYVTPKACGGTSSFFSSESQGLDSRNNIQNGILPRFAL